LWIRNVNDHLGDAKELAMVGYLDGGTEYLNFGVLDSASCRRVCGVFEAFGDDISISGFLQWVLPV